MATTKERKAWHAQYEHGQNLIKLFGLPADTDPHALYHQLHRIEAKAHRYAERACSDESFDTSDQADTKRDASIMRSVRKVLGNADVPIIINGDPRGYALKIPDTWMSEHPDVSLHRDWGRYGIICPDF